MDKFRLIAEIRRRPEMWQIRQNRYKTDMWKEVAAKLGPNVTVKECKTTWRHLRNHYRERTKRIKQRLERNALNGKHKSQPFYACKWIYYEPLKFLDEVESRRHKKIFEDLSSASDGDRDEANEVRNHSDEFSEEIEKEKDLEKEEQDILKHANLEGVVPVGDSDYNFLLSLVPLLKKMNGLQSLQFRAKISELIFHIFSQPICVVSPSPSISSSCDNRF